MRILIFLILILSFSTGSAFAYSEETAKNLENELIAPCCWAKSVASETSSVAYEMREEIRKMLAEGKTEQQIKDFYVQKYGKRILAAPEMEGFGIAAYVAPWIFLLIGLGMIYLLFETYRKKAKLIPKNETTYVSNEMQTRINEEIKKVR
ncbi:cytochrome c-type biogenesis protein CcmH [bacterium]|nr:cytochrome c-type biogenesis protein CcmH [bacterium]